jgi:hypothetical protein
MIKTLNIKAQCMRLCLVCCALFFSLSGWGQAQWGPNALPVIDMSSGETSEELSVEISGSYFKGVDQSNTFTPNLRLNIPLFSRWANLEAWYSVMDFYSRHETQDTRHETNWHNVAGDIYVSTNIQILHKDWFKRKYIPSAVARIGIKTASGGDFENRRFIDAPGYFLDLTLAEKIEFENSWARSVSIAGAIGFYCWQTGRAEQNDAYMYGLRAEFEARYLRLMTEWGGYSGWQNNRDCPMAVKAKLGVPCPLGFEPYIAYQYGIKDWGYHEVRIGVKYSIDVVK